MDQFRQLRPGERIGGLPSRPWNKMLGLLKPEADGPTLPGQPDTSVEFLVKNTTASPVPRGGVLQINAPYTLHADNASLFFESDTAKGIAPTAGGQFVIAQEPISAGGFGVCRALGHTFALVNVTDAAHTHADATTATDKLTSGTSGRAVIIHKPSGTGDKWCRVNLLGQAAGGAAGTDKFVTITAATADPFVYAGDLKTLNLSSLTLTDTGEDVYVYVADPGDYCIGKHVVVGETVGDHTDGTAMYVGDRHFYKGLDAVARAIGSDTFVNPSPAGTWQALGGGGAGVYVDFDEGSATYDKGAWLVVCHVSGTIAVSDAGSATNFLVARLGSSGGVTLTGGAETVVAYAANNPTAGITAATGGGSATLVACAHVTDTSTAEVFLECTRTNTTGLGLVLNTPGITTISRFRID